jgi:hypothetical protein
LGATSLTPILCRSNRRLTAPNASSSS